ncbi:sortase A [Haloactinospora alba]|uniref:Sortase A n=1 Tax=Haloactinospora alba TaxID=405555 RepID=A0A543NG34_9ACTN|nr:class E sortase [Haloactinospora alba]TQN30806.1 sortase A [Haloactinospora alba]
MVSATERNSHRGERTSRRRSQRGRRRKAPDANPRRSGREFLRTTVLVLGETLFTAGIVMLLFAAYQIYGKQYQTEQEQQQLSEGLEQQWEEQGPDSDPLPGEANSRMYIPSLDLDWVVVNGTSLEDIKNSPGHYSDTAAPGEEGNYSVAGHRQAGIFWDLDQLGEGDEVVLEDQENFYTYDVVDTRTVTPDQTEVVDPDPFDPENNDDPERSLLTLTTCAPKLNNTHRLIVHAELSDSRSKDNGMPDNIADMAPENSDGQEE